MLRLIIIILLVSCNLKKKYTYDSEFVNETVDRIYYLKKNKIKPLPNFADTIYKAIIICPEEMHRVFFAINAHDDINDNSMSKENYFQLNFDNIATIFLQNYFKQDNLNSDDFNLSYFIPSKLLIPIYYQHLTNKNPIWNKLIYYPLDYFHYKSEMPTPVRYCDLALDGLIYSKYCSKINFYQKIIPLDSLNLKITPRVDNRYETYYRYIPIIKAIRDSIIHELLQGKDLR